MIGTNGSHDMSYSKQQRDGLSDKVRINTVFYVMGNNVADIYQSFKL